MRLTPATSTPGSGGLRAMAGDALSPPDHAQDPASPPRVPVAGGLCAAGGRERSASRGRQRAQLHHAAPIAGLAPWLCRCPARCRAAHAATTGTAPVLPLRDPPPRPEPQALEVHFNASPGAAPGLAPAVSGTVTPAGPERWIPVAKIWIWF